MIKKQDQPTMRPLPLPNFEEGKGHLVKGGTLNAIITILRRLAIKLGEDLPTAPSHVWKATGNGNETITVSAGSILSYVDQYDPLTVEEFNYYAGGTISGVTSAGVIYGIVANALSLNAMASTGITTTNGDDTVDIFINRTIPDSTASITVAFAATLPTTAGNFIFEIAKVAHDGSVATVDRQITTSNPLLWSVEFPP